ncbi:MAG: hypothetical protein CL840_11425 [Crocinitomicaceae bacterium]|nr:hypothetical protein [Crocinitomicaceae bacterium]|tara:strand:- start:15859 stop:17247 length:1389 start_codon:yes stop_codon:yes gene_type:complete
MKITFLSLFSILLSITVLAQNWIQKDSIDNTNRAAGIAFVIGKKAYTGTGINAQGSAQSDFWEFDPEDKTNGVDSKGNPVGNWSQKAFFPGNGKWAAVGLSINGKGYIITGGDFNSKSTKQCYEYDPVNNWWTRKQDFGGDARIYATGFTIGNKGYVGTGYDGGPNKIALNDIWEYDPNDMSNGLDSRGNPMGKWTRKANFAGSPRAGAVAFTISGHAFLGTGEYSGGWFRDIWEYDPLDKSNGMDANGNPKGKWTRKMDGPVSRSFAVAFSIQKKGYVGTGEFGHLVFRDDFWEFDPFDPSNGMDAKGNPKGAWNQKANLPTVARRNAIGFSIDGKGYIGTGYDDGYKIVKSGSDFWEYNPETSSTVGVYSTSETDSPIRLYPNPTQNKLFIELEGDEETSIELHITTVSGSLVFKKDIAKIPLGENVLEIEGEFLEYPGTYFLTISKNGFAITKRFIVSP